jgi:hypothetical protein
MAPLDGDMLTAFRRAKDHELAKRRGNLSALVEEIKISQQYNTAYIRLSPSLTKPDCSTSDWAACMPTLMPRSTGS